MNIQGKAVIVTGGGNGIGRALCRRFAAEGARGVVVADLDSKAAASVAEEIGGLAVSADVSNEGDNVRLVQQATNAFGPIDLFCANAGIAGAAGGVDVANEVWQRIWDVNVMSHIFGVRAVLPGMLANGGGYLLHTASAAGLLTQVNGAPYSVTKHAVVALAEWLSIAHGDAGIKVSCLCPQGVRTQMLLGDAGERASFLLAEAIDPEDVAETVVAGLAEERFLILPHPEVAQYFQRKANDYDRWLKGMRRMNAQIQDAKH